MKTTAPLSKSILLITCFVLLITSVTADGQGRGRGKSQKQTVSKAAGLVDEADKLAEDKKYAEAIETYKIAIRLDANYAPAYGGLGDAYLNSGNSQQPPRSIQLSPKRFTELDTRIRVGLSSRSRLASIAAR